MQKYTKNMLFFAFIAMFGSLIIGQQVSVAEIESEFPPYSTQDYIYTKDIKIEPASLLENMDVPPMVMSDTVTHAYLTTAQTRTVVTREIKNGSVIITTETWTTKNPSYFTAVNTSLMIAGILASAGIASMSLYALKSINKFVDASHDDLVRAVNPEWSYKTFMEKIKVASSYPGAVKFVKDNCSTGAGFGAKYATGIGTSEQEMIKYERAATDLIEKNKYEMAVNAYNPFKVVELLKENATITTFKNNLRLVERDYKKENQDIFGMNTTVTDIAKDVGVAGAILWSLNKLAKASK